MPTQSGGAGVAAASLLTADLVGGDPSYVCHHGRQHTYCGECQWEDHGTGAWLSPPGDLG